jgi:hypothetical protein
MKSPRHALAALLLVLAPQLALAAADCGGGSISRMTLVGNRLRFEATVTRAGLTHASLVVGAPGLRLQLVASADGTVLHTIDVPPERFVTRGSSTKYDHAGSFNGRIILRDARRQHDTVRIVVSEPAAGTGALVTQLAAARVFVDTGGGCARTCVSSCRQRRGKLFCAASPAYLPFAGEGFGAFSGPQPARISSLCGMALAANDPCDFLIDERCILPYPSSRFLTPDASTPTGVRLAYPADALPANSSGKHIDPTDWNTLDGFSPGPVIMALFPDTGFPVDLGLSNVAFHTNFARSLDADHPTILMDAATGERIPHFAEMDANTDDVTKKVMIIRPGRRLEDGRRYLVAIRRLVDTHGTPIEPRLPFRAYSRVGLDAVGDVADACGTGCAATIEGRRPQMAAVLESLASRGVDTGELILAWDFTTASTQALTGFIRSIRDQAFALGTPSFSVTKITDGFSATIYREIEGTFQAPLFMSADAPASRLNLVGGVPAQNGFATVPFVVDIPRSIYNGTGSATPGRPSLWGHGLLGNRFQVRGLAAFGNEYRFVMSAVDMQGMSGADVGTIAGMVIPDGSNFHFIPERLHQGFLNHLLLGRLLVDPVNGFNSDPAFQLGGTPVIDTTEVYYSGGSQGGIFGVAIMSIAEDFKRGFVAVPAANYSTLLHRSIDFNPFLALSRIAYPDRLDEQLSIALDQQLWDRAEPQGYMNHLVAGDLSTPPVPHKILIHMSTCDSQVSNLATEIMVRSLGIPQVDPPLRHFFDIPEMTGGYDGSAFVEIDWGKCISRCNVPGGDDPGAACTTNADCPGPGDKPSRTRCDSGIPPSSNTAPAFENGAPGAEGSTGPTAPTLQQVERFLRPNGTIEQLCSGPCDPS